MKKKKHIMMQILLEELKKAHPGKTRPWYRKTAKSIYTKWKANYDKNREERAIVETVFAGERERALEKRKRLEAVLSRFGSRTRYKTRNEGVSKVAEGLSPT